MTALSQTWVKQPGDPASCSPPSLFRAGAEKANPGQPCREVGGCSGKRMLPSRASPGTLPHARAVTAQHRHDVEAAQPRLPVPVEVHVCVMRLVASVSNTAGGISGWQLSPGGGPPGLLAGMGQHQDGAHRLGEVFLWRSRTWRGRAEPALLSSPQLSLTGQGWGWGHCQPTVPADCCPHAGVQVDGQEQLLHERGCGPADVRWGQVGAKSAALAAHGVPSPGGHQGHNLSLGCPAESGLGTCLWFEPQNTCGGCPVALVLSSP